MSWWEWVLLSPFIMVALVLAAEIAFFGASILLIAVIAIIGACRK